MRRVFTILVAVVVACSMVAGTAIAAESQPESPVTLTVSVVDTDGEAVGGATIEASWAGGETEATTAANGRAFVDVPEGATVELDVEDDDFVRNRPLVVENASERDVELTVALKGQMTVTVTDSDGESVSGATVRFRRGDDVIVRGITDDQGVFESGIVEQGDYRITAVKSGFFTNGTNVQVGTDSQTQLVLERGTVQLSVSVVDDHFEAPRSVDDARVTVESGSFEANVRASRGTASINVPVNTHYQLLVTRDGYLEHTEEIFVGTSDRSVEAAIQRVPSLTVEPTNRRVVVGESTRITVRNVYDEPAAGAEVRINNRSVGETDDSGEVTATIETDGDNTIVAVRDGVESDPVTIEGIDPEDAEDQMTSTPTPTPDGDDGSVIEELPGFGFGVAAVAVGVFLSVAIFRRRRRQR